MKKIIFDGARRRLLRSQGYKASRHRTFYHGTKNKSIGSILKSGLVPKPSILHGGRPKVYLASRFQAMNYGKTLVKVKIPKKMITGRHNESYFTVEKRIKPKHIRGVYKARKENVKIGRITIPLTRFQRVTLKKSIPHRQHKRK